ncbi:macro domain-containing protein [Jeotgalibaca caeni]|uniref:macro domain-containing protein n=1 Tax=Jeotgalibaca caeni TaxID=3028623 RepID=UPI00237DCBA3|nr:macro domain-containing protein [Jeotgalibaca caeni]MDE1548332.1 macro domain-containing protein [Jeotgalibaca caeni]
MAFEIVYQDITTMKTDGIVNAANTQLQQGGGVCGAIFRAAGARELQAACDQIGSCEIGEAVITPGFHLPASFVIHTVGPIWQGGNAREAELLASAYRSSLTLSQERGLTSLAFPLISAGIYGYPKEEAKNIAIETIEEFLQHQEMDVFLVLLP